ncbi:hypothetical protein L218DRAFT_851395 [Marasmius fiardii PR-910]|nr:hypothetical protein L218DRAFT_851395 [Marasmius fiardii PR-910]
MHFLHGSNLQFTATVGDNNAGRLNGVTLSHAESAATSSASTCPHDTTLAHRHPANVNSRIVDGLEQFSPAPVDPICEPCLHGKQYCHNIPCFPTPRNQHILAYIHTDLKGPFPIQSCEGYCYWIIFVDDASDYWVVEFLKVKGDTFQELKAVVT